MRTLRLDLFTINRKVTFSTKVVLQESFDLVDGIFISDKENVEKIDMSAYVSLSIDYNRLEIIVNIFEYAIIFLVKSHLLSLISRMFSIRF